MFIYTYICIPHTSQVIHWKLHDHTRFLLRHATEAGDQLELCVPCGHVSLRQGSTAGSGREVDDARVERTVRGPYYGDGMGENQSQNGENHWKNMVNMVNITGRNGENHFKGRNVLIFSILNHGTICKTFGNR